MSIKVLTVDNNYNSFQFAKKMLRGIVCWIINISHRYTTNKRTLKENNRAGSPPAAINKRKGDTPSVTTSAQLTTESVLQLATICNNCMALTSSRPYLVLQLQ